MQRLLTPTRASPMQRRMAVYTDITDAELETFLAGYDLGQPLVFKGIAEGVENSNFLLETTRGRYVLTVYERRVKAEDLPFFLGFMAWLGEHGFPSAAPIADREGRLLNPVRGKPAAIVEFMPGLSVRRPGAGHCREAGAGHALRFVGRERLGEAVDAAPDRCRGRRRLLPVERQRLLQANRLRPTGEDRRGKALDFGVESIRRGDRVDQAP